MPTNWLSEIKQRKDITWSVGIKKMTHIIQNYSFRGAKIIFRFFFSNKPYWNFPLIFFFWSLPLTENQSEAPKAGRNFLSPQPARYKPVYWVRLPELKMVLKITRELLILIHFFTLNKIYIKNTICQVNLASYNWLFGKRVDHYIPLKSIKWQN